MHYIYNTSTLKAEFVEVGESTVPGAGDGLFARTDIEVVNLYNLRDIFLSNKIHNSKD